MGRDKIWNVSEVNAVVRELLENSLLPFWMEGEVGTLNIHRSGHVYMTLKDKKAQIKVVFFGGAAQARAMNLRVGTAVEVFGKLTAYEVRGEYQFSVKMMRPVGVGELQRRFEELKMRLEAEGLFAQERKKAIPALPGRIGVVTSPDGAAIRDFLQIINRRFPEVNVKIYPAPVQGAGAEKYLVRGIEFFNRHRNVDVIVLTRGGGSIEDLWPFNEEVLARAVAASEIPVVSAVGHEIDFTICDFVADLRVPTPSAAAELVIGRRDEFNKRLKDARKALVTELELCVERLRHRYKVAVGSYVFREPVHLLHQKQQRLDELIKSMCVAIENRHAMAAAKRDQLAARVRAFRLEAAVGHERMRLDNARHNLFKVSYQGFERYVHSLRQLEGRLKNLSPQGVLRRGFSILTDSSGKTVTSPDIPVGSDLNAYVAEGSLELTVKSTSDESVFK